MSIKYDEVTHDILLRNRDNDDIIGEVLNLFSLMLNSGDYQEWGELHETKMKLNDAFQEYENLLNILKSQQAISQYEVNFQDSAKRKYNELRDRNRDNIES